MLQRGVRPLTSEEVTRQRAEAVEAVTYASELLPEVGTLLDVLALAGSITWHRRECGGHHLVWRLLATCLVQRAGSSNRDRDPLSVVIGRDRTLSHGL